MVIERQLYKKVDQWLIKARSQNQPKVDMSISVGDIGNGNIKFESAYGEVCFPHALRQLSDSELQDVESRGALSDVFFVNGIPFVIGQKALRMEQTMMLSDSARYTEEYYGVLVAICMWLTYPDEDGQRWDVYFYGSHAPRDSMYRTNLIESVKLTWVVECAGITKRFTVHDAGAADEPVAGWTNMVIGGRNYTSFIGDPVFYKDTILVCDLGYITFDLVIFDQGIPDFLSAQSYELGIGKTLERFRKVARQNNPEYFQRVRRENPTKWREAFRTGYYRGGGLGELDVRQEADQVGKDLMRDMLKYIDMFGGIGEYEGFAWNGGGSGAASTHIEQNLQHPCIAYTALDKGNRLNMDDIHMATARGLRKRAILLKAEKKL